MTLWFIVKSNFWLEKLNKRMLLKYNIVLKDVKVVHHESSTNDMVRYIS